MLQKTTWMLALGPKSYKGLPTCLFRVIRQLAEGRSLAASQRVQKHSLDEKQQVLIFSPAPSHRSSLCVGLTKPELNLNHILPSPNCQPCAGCFCICSLEWTNGLTNQASRTCFGVPWWLIRLRVQHCCCCGKG